MKFSISEMLFILLTAKGTYSLLFRKYDTKNNISKIKKYTSVENLTTLIIVIGLIQVLWVASLCKSDLTLGIYLGATVWGVGLCYKALREDIYEKHFRIVKYCNITKTIASIAVILEIITKMPLFEII